MIYFSFQQIKRSQSRLKKQEDEKEDKKRRVEGG